MPSASYSCRGIRPDSSVARADSASHSFQVRYSSSSFASGMDRIVVASASVVSRTEVVIRERMIASPSAPCGTSVRKFASSAMICSISAADGPAGPAPTGASLTGAPASKPTLAAGIEVTSRRI